MCSTHTLLFSIDLASVIILDEFAIPIRIRAVQMRSDLAVTKHLPLYVKNILTDRLHEKPSPPTLPKPYQLLLGTEDLEVVLPVEEGDILADQHSSTAVTTRYFFPASSGQGY